MTTPDWPEPPDPLGHLIALVEDIRNLIQASSAPVLGSGVADETPGGGEHSPAPAAGPPTLTEDELKATSWGLRCYGAARDAPEFWNALADKFVQ